ncbi:glycerophosphodiester phosphodiesterase family protein [Acidihalobacter prosperus]
MSIICNVIAHRGNKSSFPENTLESFVSALDLGATAIELDVQITSDQTAVISHDVELTRCCGTQGNITQMTVEQLNTVTAYEPQRFGTQFYGIRMPTLQSVVYRLNTYKNIEVFVEIKTESIQHHGRIHAINCLHTSLKKANFNWTLISFDAAVLKEAQLRFSWKTGWVLSEDNSWDIESISYMQPQFIFASLDALKAHTDKLPFGQWDWVIYGVNNVDDLKYILARNIFSFETDRLDFMLKAISDDMALCHTSIN